MLSLQRIHHSFCVAAASLVLAVFVSPAYAGTASSVPATIAGAVLINNTVAVKGNPLTYSTQVPLSAGGVYYVYVKVSPGTFNGVPNPVTVFTSTNATLQTALQASVGTLSTDKSFVVYQLPALAAVVPVNATIAFAPQGATGNDGSVNGLANLVDGGVVAEQISIGSTQNLATPQADIDIAAGGNIIIFEASAPPATACGLAIQAGYWWNPSEPGRGYVIEQQGNALYFGAFMYANSGEAIWYQASGAMSNTMNTTGAFCTLSAPLDQYANGQTFGGAYTPASAPTVAGNVTISFYDDTHGSINWGQNTVTNIQRYPLVTGGLNQLATATQPQSGFWWNPAEPGRGYTLEVQGNEMFYAGFMYDTAGNPIWYATGPAPLATSTSYMGNFQQYCCGQTLLGPFKASSIANADVGATTLQFSSATSGVMTYPNGTQIPIQRFAFTLPTALPIITVATGGNGAGSVTASTGSINCGTVCSGGYAVGTQVTLTPMAAAGSNFAGWTGACTGAGACVIEAGPNVNVGAIFTLATSSSIAVTVAGPGTVTSSPAGISCTQFGGAGCSASFALNTSVTLTATPNTDGSTFASWGPGACANFAVDGTCGFTINGNANAQVQAKFLPPTAVQGQ